MTSRASAQTSDVDLNPLAVDIHGFVSQGFILTTENNYLAPSKKGSVEFTEVGLNLTKSFTDDIRIGVQLFARDLGPAGNYRPQFDWFYLDYRLRDEIGLRAGRTKIPFGLYNEVNDVDAARVPILLPQSLYPYDNRTYLLAQIGAELYGTISLARAGDLEYRVYGGTLSIDTMRSQIANATVDRVTAPYLFGGRAMWLTPVPGLQAGFSLQALRIDADYHLAADSVAAIRMRDPSLQNWDGVVPTKSPLLLWVASIEYAAQNWQLAAEYGRWADELQSQIDAAYPDLRSVSERYYALAAYHVTPWFTPALYYSGFFYNVQQRHGRDNYQHDIAATLRFDLTTHWLIKIEGHLFRGTAQLDSSLNDGKPLSDLTLDWTALLLKTTGYF